MQRQRVLIGDPSATFRETVRQVLACTAEWHVVAEQSTGAEAISDALRLQPDVAILDVHLPDVSGLEAAKELRRKLPQMRVVLLLSYDDAAYRIAAARHGATCAAKDRLVEELPAALASCAIDVPAAPDATASAPHQPEEVSSESETYTCLGVTLPQTTAGRRSLTRAWYANLGDAIKPALAIFLIGTLLLIGTAWLGASFDHPAPVLSEGSDAIIDEAGLLGQPGAIVRLDQTGREAYIRALAAARQRDLATCTGIAFLALVVGSAAIGWYEAKQRVHLSNRPEGGTIFAAQGTSTQGRL